MTEGSSSEDHAPSFVLELEQLDGYEFRVKFDLDGVDDLFTDEPPPLGQGSGPNPSRLLAVAVGNCLSASLLFCLQKARIEGARLHTTVSGRIERNENKRLRIGGVDVRIELSGVDEAGKTRLGRCLGLYEDFCVVTESVRNGLEVNVEVVTTDG